MSVRQLLINQQGNCMKFAYHKIKAYDTQAKIG
jgi:hypothetical protein